MGHVDEEWCKLQVSIHRQSSCRNYTNNCSSSLENVFIMHISDVIKVYVYEYVNLLVYHLLSVVLTFDFLINLSLKYFDFH